jgi:hypothetical protein
MDPTDDPGVRAVELMMEWGPVFAGTPSGDFGVIELVDHPGWVVTCHHPHIMTYVSPDEIDAANPSEVAIGLRGRGKRDQDAEDLNIRHIEQRQQPA